MAREGIRHILSSTRYRVSPEEAADEGGVLARLSRESEALLILDENLHHERTADVIRDLKTRAPAARIVVLSESFDMGGMTATLNAGADGYCLATIGCETLVKYLDLVMLGEKVFPAAMVITALSERGEEASSPPRFYSAADAQRMQVIASSAPSRMLSAREAEILHCLMEGAPNKMIARKLDVAEATVKVHVKAILRKIRVTNRTQAAMWAVTHFSNEAHDNSASLPS